jgi:hypothetical protein
MSTPEDLSLVPDEVLFFVDKKGGKGRGRASAWPSAAVGRGQHCPMTARRSGINGLKTHAVRQVAEAPPEKRASSPGGWSDSTPDRKLKEWTLRQVRPRAPKSDVHNNTYAVLEHEDESCTMAGRLWGKAKATIQHLAGELGVEPVRDLPEVIRCGQLRTAVASCFPEPSELSLEARLSIKTVQKLERSCCRSCEPSFRERLDRWREARFRPLDVDERHLALFKRMFKANVRRGWNRHSYPFIPNGNASLSHGRRDGGNWHAEPFSRRARAELVFSAGKPRVVTIYSSHNNRVMQPLHNSLQRENERGGWLLVGPPGAEHVKSLSGEGDYLSFDYEAATDNIKQPYVSAAVEALIECADPELSDDQKRCLRVLSELRLEEDGPVATHGQPMGSLMSFPLLCLINKTVVDLALADLLQGGQLSFKEWTSHRLLVNGDDLLTREPRRKPGSNSLAEAVFRHGGQVGLKTNWEKTLRDPIDAEINSTLFREGEPVKKVNAASLYMKPETVDVLGYALESTKTVRGFRRVVRANAKLLALQDRKEYRHLPPQYRRACKQDRKIRAALVAAPVGPREPTAANFFPVSPRPEDYALSREEEVQCINERVDKIRPYVLSFFVGEDGGQSPSGCAGLLRKGRTPTEVLKGARSWRSVKYEKKPRKAEESILSVLAKAWEDKQKRTLVEEESWTPPSRVIGPSDGPGGRACAFIDAIRAFRNAERLRCDPITLAFAEMPFAEGSSGPSEGLAEYVLVSG